MGLLTTVLNDPLKSAVLGAAVAAAILYVWTSYVESGKEYATKHESQQMYLQAAAAGSVLAFASSYLFFSQKPASQELPSAGNNTGGGESAGLLEPEAVGGGSGAEQTMLTEPFD